MPESIEVGSAETVDKEPICSREVRDTLDDLLRRDLLGPWEGEAEVITGESTDPVIITVDQFGDLYLDLGEERNLPVDAVTLQGRLRTLLRHNPRAPILVKGDAAVDYGKVVQAMVLAQGAGAPSVGLITVPPERPEP